jgi:hypothetical protein
MVRPAVKCIKVNSVVSRVNGFTKSSPKPVIPFRRSNQYI